LADISALQGLAPVSQIDLDNYATSAPPKRFQLPPRGEYTLQARSAFPSDAFGVSRSGSLSVQIDPTIVGPTHEGTELRYTRIYGTVYQRDGVNVSQIGDYLKACGVTGVFATPQDLANAIEQTANLPFRAYLDWEARSKDGSVSVKGMVNFPKLEDGSFQPFVEHPTEKQDDGSAKRVWANLVIKNFVAA